VGKLRCWPGCIAEILCDTLNGHLTEGMHCTVLRLIPAGSRIECADGSVYVIPDPAWDVDLNGQLYVFRDRSLRPISPKPDPERVTREEQIEA
jgi:hypothetical protein